jgi:hypothetical protein
MQSNKQIIDTSNDYMALIYDFVVKKEDKKDIYDIIKNDFNAFLISDSYVPSIINNKIFAVDTINSWMYDYINNLSEKNKNKIYKKFGHATLLKELSAIADLYSYRSYNDFVNSEEDHEIYILQYIMENYIIKDIIPQEYFDCY